MPSYSKSCLSSPATCHTHSSLPRHTAESKGLGQPQHIGQKVERPRGVGGPLLLEASTSPLLLSSAASRRGLAHTPQSPYLPIKVMNCSCLPRLTVAPEPLY